MKRPELVGHRGYASQYPENTIVGIQAAIEAGASYVEIDVQLTSDFAPVLFHDRTLERLCGEQGAIHDFTLAEIATFKASYFERFGYRFAQNPVATLDQLVSLMGKHPGVTVFVEIKRISIEQFTLATVAEHILEAIKPISSQCVVISYSLDVLAIVRDLGWNNIGAVIDDWQDRNREEITRLQPRFLFCDIDGLPKKGMLSVPGIKLAVFESVDPGEALALAERGVEFVETFAIGEMLTAISSIDK